MSAANATRQREGLPRLRGLLLIGSCALLMCACTPTRHQMKPHQHRHVAPRGTAAPVVPDSGKATAEEVAVPAEQQPEVAPPGELGEASAKAAVVTPAETESPQASMTESTTTEPTDTKTVESDTDSAAGLATATDTDVTASEAKPHGPAASQVTSPESCPPGSASSAANGQPAAGGPYAVGPPRPETPYGNWVPPGLAPPWPYDEYLHDGGDTGVPVYVSDDWEVSGLELTDTVAHFDTLDGRRLVQPSNRVDLYSPRFAAVRTVTRLGASNQVDAPRGVEMPERLNRYDDVQLTTTTLQNEQVMPQIGRRRASGYLLTEGDGMVSTTLKARGFQDAFLPFEDFLIMRRGQVKQAEEARLALGQQAAIAWTGDQAVQVTLDSQRAAADTQYEGIGTVYFVDETPGPARLRVIKIASDQIVKPGETVDFTIRYDNVGLSTIGNVTVLDNLTTRLEFVPGSAQSSREADFFTEHNEGGSQILRWEIVDPLEPGDGGLVRFRCRVR